MPKLSAKAQIDALYKLDAEGRIRGTREPAGSSGPRLAVVRDREAVAWALRHDVESAVAREIAHLAVDEGRLRDPAAPLRHAKEYQALLGGRPWAGPAFEFPATVGPVRGVVLLGDRTALAKHFAGWAPGEVQARGGVLAVMDGADAVSICFSARRSDSVAEAGVETAAAWRGRGLAGRVVTAWASRVRAEGLEPSYSTEWTNVASLAVAKKLGLRLFAVDWSIGGA